MKINKSGATITVAVTLITLGIVTSSALTQAALPPVNLIYFYDGSGAPRDVKAVQEAMNVILKKKINATVELRPFDWGSYEQKLNLTFASGERCDLAFTASWLNYPLNASKGNFLPIDNLLPKYAPNLYKFYNSAQWNGVKVQGKIFGAIANTFTPNSYGFITRADLAKKYNLNLARIKTYEDLMPYLEQLKGKEQIVPIGITKPVFEYFGWDPLLPWGLSVRYDDAQLKVFNGLESDEFRKFVKLMRSWHEAGYTPKEPVSLSDAQAGLRAGKYGIYIHAWSPGSNGPSAYKNLFGRDVVGKSLSPQFISSTAATSNITSVCRTSPNPERSLMFLELMHTDSQLYTLMTKGIEGKHWVWKDKARKIIGLPDGVTVNNSGYSPQTDWMFGANKGFYYTSPEDIIEQRQGLQISKNAKTSVALGFALNTDTIKSQVAQMNATFDELVLPLIQGIADPDVALPILYARLKAVGGDTIVTEAQRQIDEWKKTK